MSGALRVGDWIVRPKRRLIERGDESIQIRPKSMAVFECLVAARGEPVSRNELLETVWPGADVTDDVLTKSIVELRRAFGDSAREAGVIETIPKMGFRLVLPAQGLEEELQGSRSQGTDLPGRQGKWRRFRSVGLVSIAVVLISVALASFSGTRVWLTEAGINLFLKTAAFLSPSGTTQRPGIAVLPLMNFSGDPENEYFSDGMSVELINRLARSNRVPVIARSSSFEFKDRPQDVREVGRRLGVTHVLEGSVRRADEKIRLTVQLIDATTGAHVWSGVYQRELGDVFELQQEIASEIVDQIYLAIGDRIAPPPDGVAAGFMKNHPPANLKAYDLYLKGVEMVTSNRPALIEQAAGYFDRAIALESDYADAWAGKGYSLLALGGSGSGSMRIPASVFPGAIAAFRRALEIQPGHAFARGWLGVALMLNDFKWAEGLELMEQSLAKNPNNAALLAVYGFYLDTMHLDGAEQVLESAYRLDPLGIEPIIDRAVYLLRQGRLLDAAALMETSLIQDREGYAPNYFTAMFNFRIGRLDVAEERLRKARQVAHPDDLNLDILQWMIDDRRGKGPIPLDEIWERMQTQPVHGAVLWANWIGREVSDEKASVAVFELAIEQRLPSLRTALFRDKPALMPEADWRRFREITGVAQFQQSLGQ